jgi:two-component system OmpR family sensor kinase
MARPSIRSLSLRTRVLLGTLAIVTVALAIFSLATTTVLRSYLLDRVDLQLTEAREPLLHGPRQFGDPNRPAFENDGLGRPDRVPGSNRFGSSALAFEVFDESGATVAQVPSGLTDTPDPLPLLPSLTYDSAQAMSTPLTVEAEGNPSFHYRALITTSPTSRHIIVMAVPINDDDATIARLLVVEVIVALAVLVVAGLAGLRVVRVGLRPLDDMTDTATEIAAGDLSHRVDLPADRQDEVGRLGGALNSMLSQIEAAFHERELSEEQLRQFVADASHELRTPLTSIRGYAELYRRGALPTTDAVDDAIHRIEDEAARMSVLVDDLLLLARLDQGRPLEQEPVDLLAITADAIRDSGAVDPDRPITFEHDDEVVVVGDPTRLHQVVANLLDNARVHTPSATPVNVATRIEDDDALVVVSDHGPGLAPEVAARVFERSFRGDNGTRPPSGSGLGLSIVKAIAEAHGGTATVQSTLGAGTTFTVRVPLSGTSSVRP